MGALLGHQNGVLKLKFALDLEEWVELPGNVPGKVKNRADIIHF